MADEKDIQKALNTFAEIKSKYTTYQNYYDGVQAQPFDTQKFQTAVSEAFKNFASQYRLNLCPAVCDALKDKLIIENFRVESGDKDLQKFIWQLWQANRMGKRSGEIHTEAVVKGDGYVQVWVNPEGRTTIYPQKAERCFVVYDEETPGRILWAAKYWNLPDKRVRVNLFYPDRTEKYVSKKATDGALPKGAADLEAFKEDGADQIPNPYNIVPMFHFGNNAATGAGGKSELVNAVPIQDSLNRTVMDKFVAMQFASFLQRWATGIESNFDEEGNAISPFIAGVEKVWTTENPDAKFGTFPASDLRQFLEVKNSAIIDMPRVTGTPLWYFMQTDGGFPSGEALKKSETRFINKVRDRMEGFGQAWEDVMSFALRIENKKDVRLFTEWSEAEPLSRKEDLENILIEKELGISEEQALIEAGYGEADIARMMAEKQAKADAMINAFNAGETDDEV